MGRHIHLQTHLPLDELERRYRTAQDPHEHVWWQVLWLLAQGRTATELAGVTGYSAYWIGQIAKRYNEQGPDGMRNRQRTRSRRTTPLLSPERQEELRQALAGPAPEEDRWSGRTVAEWMTARLGRPVSRYRGWVYLQQLKPRHGVPRPHHALADAAQQEAFKKKVEAAPSAGGHRVSARHG
jgi:transposase